MSSIINALTDIFKGLVELVWSFFTTAGELVQKTAQFALKFATEILDLVVNFFRGLVDLAGGIVSFVLGGLICNYDKGSTLLTSLCRKCFDAWRGRSCGVRIPAVPEEPGKAGQGWEQEAELAYVCAESLSGGVAKSIVPITGTFGTHEDA